MTKNLTSKIIFILLLVIILFMFFGVLFGLKNAIPSSNPYGLWLPILIFVVFLVMVLIGWSKAKAGFFSDF